LGVDCECAHVEVGRPVRRLLRNPVEK